MNIVLYERLYLVIFQVFDSRRGSVHFTKGCLRASFAWATERSGGCCFRFCSPLANLMPCAAASQTRKPKRLWCEVVASSVLLLSGLPSAQWAKPGFLGLSLSGTKPFRKGRHLDLLPRFPIGSYNYLSY